MASGGRKECLACAETVLFRYAIREREPAVCIVLENRDAVGMRVHLRFLVCSIVDSEHAHLLVFEFYLVMFRVHLDGVLTCCLGFWSRRHDVLLSRRKCRFTGGNRSIVRGTVRVKSKHHPQFLALSLVYVIGKLADVCSSEFRAGLSFTATEAAKGRAVEPASPHIKKRRYQ